MTPDYSTIYMEYYRRADKAEARLAALAALLDEWEERAMIQASLLHELREAVR